MSEWTTQTTPERLAAILKAIGRQQYQLARLLGVSPVTVSRWANGHHVPDPRSQDRLEMIEQRFVKSGKRD